MAAYGDDSSRSALTIIPPVVKEDILVSWQVVDENKKSRLTSDSTDGFLSGKISDVYKGIVEGGKDAEEEELRSARWTAISFGKLLYSLCNTLQR
jgi:hypothetical protein